MFAELAAAVLLPYCPDESMVAVAPPATVKSRFVATDGVWVV